jgi:hypothetical protein
LGGTTIFSGFGDLVARDQRRSTCCRPWGEAINKLMREGDVALRTDHSALRHFVACRHHNGNVALPDFELAIERPSLPQANVSTTRASSARERDLSVGGIAQSSARSAVRQMRFQNGVAKTKLAELIRWHIIDFGLLVNTTDAVSILSRNREFLAVMGFTIRPK